MSRCDRLNVTRNEALHHIERSEVAAARLTSDPPLGPSARTLVADAWLISPRPAVWNQRDTQKWGAWLILPSFLCLYVSGSNAFWECSLPLPPREWCSVRSGSIPAARFIVLVYSSVEILLSLTTASVLLHWLHFIPISCHWEKLMPSLASIFAGHIFHVFLLNGTLDHSVTVLLWLEMWVIPVLVAWMSHGFSFRLACFIPNTMNPVLSPGFRVSLLLKARQRADQLLPQSAALIAERGQLRGGCVFKSEIEDRSYAVNVCSTCTKGYKCKSSCSVCVPRR